MSDSESTSVTENAKLLSRLVDSPPEPQSVLAALRIEMVKAVGDFKLRARHGSVARLFFNALLQDLHVMEAVLDAIPKRGPAAEIAPVLETLLAKLHLAGQIYPAGARQFHQFAEKIAALRNGVQEWTTLRLLLQGLLSGPIRFELCAEAKALLTTQSSAGSESILQSLLNWSAESAGPPVTLTELAQITEAFALHLALREANDQLDDEHAEVLSVCLEAIHDWLVARGVVAIQPKQGARLNASQRVVFRQFPSANGAHGVIEKVIANGYKFGQTTLIKPTVLVSPGAGPKVLERANALLHHLDHPNKPEFQSRLQTLSHKLRRRLKSPVEDFHEYVLTNLDIIEALRKIDAQQFEASLIEAFQLDFEDTGLEIIAPAPLLPCEITDAYEVDPVYNDDHAAGTILERVSLGVKLESEILKPARVTVSFGAAPKEKLASLARALEHRNRTDAKAQLNRLYAALNNVPNDDGRQLAIALFELLGLEKAPLNTILNTLLDFKLPILQSLTRWRNLVEFIEANFGFIDNHRRSSQRMLKILTAPYKRALQQKPKASELQLWHLTAVTRLPLLNVDPILRERAFYFALNEMRFASITTPTQSPQATQQFLETTAALLSSIWNAEGDKSALKRFLMTLKGLGVQVFPNVRGEINPCDNPKTLFSRFDTRYDADAPRGCSIGPVYPALRWENLFAPGFIKLSLGPRPKLVTWLHSNESQQSPIGFANKRLTAEFIDLDEQRLVNELKGLSRSKKTFLDALRQLIDEALEACGESLNSEEPTLQPLFEILKQDYAISAAAALG